MRKILLVSGCSFTDKNWYSDFYPEMDSSWPKWPELLAEKLDMDCVNLGQSGAGNEYIYSSILDYVCSNPTGKIGLVVAAWSQIHRKDFQSIGNWRNYRVDPHGDVFSWMNKTLRYYLSFQILMEKYNLDYRQVQMLDPFNDYLNGLKYGDGDVAAGRAQSNDIMFTPIKDKPKAEKQLFSNILWYENVLNTEKFLGWPINPKIGGYFINRKLDQSLKVSELDGHPNKAGQIKIMELLYDWLGPRVSS